MVQFHRHGGQTGSRAHWWKLGDRSEDSIVDQRARQLATEEARRFLTTRGFVFQQCTNLLRLNYSCSRVERGLLCYEKCSISELRAFCAARHIKGVGDKRMRMVDVIDRLEAADEDIIFDRFIDLPAELRLLVYTYTFEPAIGSKILFMAPPPVAHVSQLLRKESLHIFYNLGQLAIDCEWHGLFDGPKIWYHSRSTQQLPGGADDPNDAVSFVYRAPTTVQQAVKSFTFRVSKALLPGNSQPQHASCTKWLVTSPHNGKPFSSKRISSVMDVPELAPDSCSNLQENGRATYKPGMVEE